MDAKLGLRPGLHDVQERQVRVLEQLERRFPDVDAVRRWKRDCMHAGVGRLSPGLRALLADEDLSALIEPYFLRDDVAAEEFRLLLHDLLVVEFAWPVEDVSRISHELFPGKGISEARLGAPGNGNGGPHFAR